MAELKTKVFAVEDHLKTLLLSLEAIDGATRELGTPASRQDRHVWIDGDHDVTQTYEVSGLAEKHEEFPVSIRVFRRAAVKTYAEVRDLASADAAEIEAAIGADPTLGGLAELAVVAGLTTAEWFTDENHRACGIELVVQCSTNVR
jgi:hypothetical protein